MGQYLYKTYFINYGISPLKSLLNCFISEQCVESRLQVKMNSPDSARDISIKQEQPEDQPHFSKFNHFIYIILWLKLGIRRDNITGIHLIAALQVHNMSM